MRLFHITTVSDSLSFLQGQLAFYRERSMGVTVVSRPDERLTDFARTEGIDSVPVPMKRSIDPFSDVRAIGKLVRVFLRKRPGIVHAHTPKGGLLGMIAAWLTRVPVRIYHIRGLPYMGMTGRMRILMKATERVSCALATEVFCVSHGIAAVAKADGLVPPEKVRVFLKGSGNGVDALNRFNPARFSLDERNALRNTMDIPNDASVVLFVGRLANDKGIRELSSAWAQVIQRNPGAHLLIVGSEDERDPADSASMHALGAMESVHFAGYQSDAAPYYAASDLLVLPTYREGFPNVLLEAAAMALPAIATDIPGCIDAIVDGSTGTIVPVQNAGALADAIVHFLSDGEKRSATGFNAREHVLENYDQRRIWAEIYNRYEQLVADHGTTLKS